MTITMEEQKCTHEEAKRAYYTGHYPYMIQAFAVAATRCHAWRLAKDGTPCSLFDVLEFAQHYDDRTQREKGDRSFFYVSLEGAIGYSPTGLEFNVEWIFIPMEPGAERVALINRAMKDFERAEREEEAKTT